MGLFVSLWCVQVEGKGKSGTGTKHPSSSSSSVETRERFPKTSRANHGRVVATIAGSSPLTLLQCHQCMCMSATPTPSSTGAHTPHEIAISSRKGMARGRREHGHQLLERGEWRSLCKLDLHILHRETWCMKYKGQL